MNESGNNIYYAALLVLAFTFFYDNTWAQASETSTKKTHLKPVSFNGIRGRVFDAATQTILPARIVITDDTGHVYNSYYTKLRGFFTEEDGSFQLSLHPGKYTLEVFRGIDYLSEKISFEITSEKGVEVNSYLHQWYPLKKEGWYSGDGHDHLYTENKPDTAMIRLVRKICLAQGIDFVVAAQGWAGYNDSNWKDGSRIPYPSFHQNNHGCSSGQDTRYDPSGTWAFLNHTKS